MDLPKKKWWFSIVTLVYQRVDQTNLGGPWATSSSHRRLWKGFTFGRAVSDAATVACQPTFSLQRAGLDGMGSPPWQKWGIWSFYHVLSIQNMGPSLVENFRNQWFNQQIWMYSILKAMAEHWGDDGTQKYMSTFFFWPFHGDQDFWALLAPKCSMSQGWFSKNSRKSLDLENMFHIPSGYLT